MISQGNANACTQHSVFESVWRGIPIEERKKLSKEEKKSIWHLDAQRGWDHIRGKDMALVRREKKKKTVKVIIFSFLLIHFLGEVFFDFGIHQMFLFLLVKISEFLSAFFFHLWLSLQNSFVL